MPSDEILLEIFSLLYFLVFPREEIFHDGGILLPIFNNFEILFLLFLLVTGNEMTMIFIILSYMFSIAMLYGFYYLKVSQHSTSTRRRPTDKPRQFGFKNV